jgi:hypothetical protein
MHALIGVTHQQAAANVRKPLNGIFVRRLPDVVNDLGWIATAVFVASYLFSHPLALRLAQMIGALLWISYGLFIHASPVIAANALVFIAAAWTTWRAWYRPKKQEARISDDL